MTEYIVLTKDEWSILYQRAFEKGKAEERKQTMEVIKEWKQKNV